MQIIAIAGVGLIGGSFGLALRKRGFPGKILGVSSPKTVEKALELGAIDEGVTMEEAAARADVILLAQPISVILQTIDRIKAYSRPDCLVTDAGSTKRLICKAGEGLPSFLGGHPMAGKETSGVESADADLFVGRPWVFCPPSSEESVTPAASAYLELVRECGAVCVWLSPEEHDRTVALTSHLPQMASTALALALQKQGLSDESLAISGPGLRDMTRLALGSWSVWKDILDSNTDSIDHVLSVYIDTLDKIRENLQTQRISGDFTTASEIASRIRRGQVGDRQRGDSACESALLHRPSGKTC
jgi:prephenate dehydrogenase